jgi:hypothetical protein
VVAGELMQLAPVWAAARPCASTKPIWRLPMPVSFAISCASASGALAPARIAARPFGPYAGSTKDCVATAPTPGSAHATSEPTLNQCDCTATPMSPVAASRATIEKVFAGRIAEPLWLPSAGSVEANVLRPRQ